MSLPSEIFKARDPWDQFNKACSWVESLAVRSEAENHLLYLGQFMGTWENSGNILHQAAVWGDLLPEMHGALQFFRCEKAYQALLRAIELYKISQSYNDDDEDPPESFWEEVSRVEEDAYADTTYEKLAAVLYEKRSLFYLSS